MPPAAAPRWLNRLDTQLVVGFLAASLVPSLLVGTLMAWSGLDLAERAVRENVSRTADAYGAGLDLFVQRQRGRLAQLARGSREVEALSSAVVATPGLEAVWDPDGAASVPGPAAWAQTACTELVAGAQADASHAGAGQAHEVVIVVQHAGAALCAQLTFTLHQDMLTEQASSLLGGQAYIVDPSGTIVCHTFDESGSHDPRGQVLSGAVSAVAQAGQEWSGRVAGEDGEVIAAYAPSTELAWGIWVEVPEAQALRPFWTGIWRSLLLAAAIATLLAGLAVVLARRLAAPVQSVAAAVGRIAAGELGAEMPVQGTAEVAALAREVNSMSRALARSHAELEARVADRTRALSEARSFSDRLLDTMHQQIIVFDPELRVVRANAAALVAHGPSLMGAPAGRLAPADPPGPTTADRVLSTGEPRLEERSLGPEGPVLEVETVPLHSENGSLIGVLEIARDVTEQRRMLQHLAHQEKMAALGTLAAGLAHEIGNPLASMSSELEMLERLWDPEDARAALPVLREQIRRMSRLLRDLVDLGRRPSAHRSAVDPLAVAQEVARLLRHDPRSRGVAVTVVGSGGPAVQTQRDGLVQVLLNLGLNALDAVQHTPEGAVELRVAHSAQGCELEVWDNGPGLAPALAARVFDPFFTTKAPGAGTGLGLFVSAQIVRGLGGRLEHQPGEPGTCFRLVLPTAVPEPTP